MTFDCHILLAEDNPVNQDVGRAMLESFGCRVDVASNGQEVLDKVVTEDFDIIFMDCEMPVLDGFGATKKIRAIENEEKAKVPVIALTAHIMEDDRTRCFSAGMNDYLSKPFRLQELSDVLQRWIAPKSGEIEASPPRNTEEEAKSEYSFDREVVLLDRRCLESIKSLQGSGGSDMLKAVIQIYLTDAPALLEELSESSASRDSESVARAAHALKSSSANLGAVILAGKCKILEEIARANSIESTEPLVAQIREEYERVKEALECELRGGV